jgi:hypothetical protein
MQEKNRERWQQLCERATLEQDPEKLLSLVEEINKLLPDKYRRILPTKPPSNSGERPAA